MRPIVSLWVGGAGVDRAADAALGEPVWSPDGLLADLELRLGVAPAEVSDADREAVLLSALDALVGRGLFFERSFALDRSGTCAVLASLRDALVSAGWEGERVADGGPRLEALAALEAVLTQSPLPFALGTGDRVRAVERALAQARSAPYTSLRLLDERALWPARWQRVFARLEALGTRVELEAIALEPSCAQTDLGRTQRAMLGGDAGALSRWEGDGSLTWLRARTGWELGEAAAGALRDHGGADALVVALGDTAALDAALSLQGLATIGMRRSTTLRPPLQVLSLALSLVFGPRDPVAALELLTLPAGPFQGRIAGELARALARQPGIGGRNWQAAKVKLAGSLDGLDAAEALKEASRLERIDSWLEGPSFDRDAGAPKAALLAATGRVSAWVLDRLSAEDRELWKPLLAAARELERLLIDDARDALQPHEVDALVARALGRGMSWRSTREESGRMAHVASPHGVHRAHDTVLVWHAGADTNGAARRSPLRVRERRALRSAGIDVIDDDRYLEAEARAWRRVLGAAGSRLIIATPESSLGNPQLALPLWDEIIAVCGAKTADVARVTRDVHHVLEGGATTQAHVPLPLPASRVRWTVPTDVLGASLAAIESWSPSSLGVLLGCPLRYVLDRIARVRPGELATLPGGPLLYGNLGHRLAEDLFASRALGSVTRTEAEVDALLDRLIATEASVLLMPGMADELAQLRSQLRRAMVALSTLIEQNGLRALASETDAQTAWGTSAVAGRIDLLLTDDAGQDTIVDLKWGTSSHGQNLKAGRGLQLAMYLEAHGKQSSATRTPHAAFFGLRTGRALQLDGGPFSGAPSVPGEALPKTWIRAARTTQKVLAELSAGRIPVPGVDGGNALLGLLEVPDKDRPGHYDAAPDSSCGYCEYGALCGRDWEGFR